MIVAGLTGGICAGKSTISKIIRAHGIPVVDADQVSRDVVMPGTKGLECVVSTFGAQYTTNNGELDRKKLGELVFHNKEAMAVLNHLMAPLMESETELQISSLSKHNQIIVYDSALIIEWGKQNKYRPLCVVWCPPNVQLARLMKRNNLSQVDAEARLNSQLSIYKKIGYADFLIDSNKPLEESAAQAEQFVSYLKQYKEKQND